MKPLLAIPLTSLLLSVPLVGVATAQSVNFSSAAIFTSGPIVSGDGITVTYAGVWNPTSLPCGPMNFTLIGTVDAADQANYRLAYGYTFPAGPEHISIISTNATVGDSVQIHYELDGLTLDGPCAGLDWTDTRISSARAITTNNLTDTQIGAEFINATPHQTPYTWYSNLAGWTINFDIIGGALVSGPGAIDRSDGINYSPQNTWERLRNCARTI